MSPSPDQWNDLCDAIRDNECVLLLGPKAAEYEGEPLQQLLADRLANKLRRDHKIADNECPTQLFEVVKLYHDQHKDRAIALQNIKLLMNDFYAQFSPSDLPTYQLVAELPFRYIINTTPDDLAAQTLAQNDRVPLFFHYNFFEPEHNALSNRKATDLDQQIDIDQPLLYNLMGHYSRPDSLVLTDDDRLKFIEKILQTDKDSLPPNIAYYFTNKPRFRMQKTYLFIGFDFNDWHLRLLMHLLRRSQNLLPQTFTLQAPESLHADVHFFYSKSFEMLFVDTAPQAFLTELRNRLKKPAEVRPTQAISLYLLYHEKDTPLREELEKHLAPLRSSGLVEMWHEGKILASSDIDQSIATHLQTARIIISLVTANFMDSDQLYDQQLQIALKRHKEGTAKLVPILMTPYDLYDTVFDDLNTLLPKPRGKAISQNPNREEALSGIATDIRQIIERIKNPTKINIL